MTMFRVGPAGIPGSLKTDMNTVLNKKFGTTGQDYPPADWPADVNLMGPLPEKTIVSSPIADFSDGADDVPTKSLVVTIPASLSGVSSVTETQTGKNLLDMTVYDGGVYNPDIDRVLNLTVSETQFTKNGNVYSVTTSASWKTFTVLFPIISGTTYYEKWTLSVESGQQGSTRAYLDEDFKVLAKYNNNTSDPIVQSGVFTPPSGVKYLAITWTNRGTAVQTLNITEPMIEIGSSSSAWEAYSGTTYTASLGRTIYGGQVDIVNGAGTDEGVIEVFDTIEGNVIKSQFNSFNKVNGNISVLGTNVRIAFVVESGDQSAYNRISNTYEADEQICNLASHSFSYASDTTHWYRNTVLYLFLPVTDVGITAESVYNYLTGLITNGTPLKFYLPYNTPTDYTFTGQEVPTRLGYNAFWSDEGDTEVTYRADINLLINNQ